MNTKVLITLALVSLACTSQLTHEKESFIFAKFQQFMEDHNKNYGTIDEFASRFNTFKENYLDIERLTLENTEATHRVGINQFSDMTFEEFRKTYLNLDFTGADFKDTGAEIPSMEDLPESLDWRTKGAVSPVKNQGSCGSCWAFSTVGHLEGANQIKTGELVTFSEGELVDCDHVDHGCSGRLMGNAFKFIEDNGLETDKDYPYKPRRGQCKSDRSKSAVGVKDFSVKQNVNSNDYKVLINQFPLAVAVNANSFFQYDSGILDLSSGKCDPSGLNHGVTVVGYGVENGVEYLIIKNSWGPNWGEAGYIRIANNGTCGINKYVSFATLR
jgi:C1A family cysteine protease